MKRNLEFFQVIGMGPARFELAIACARGTQPDQTSRRPLFVSEFFLRSLKYVFLKPLASRFIVGSPLSEALMEVAARFQGMINRVRVNGRVGD
jgi:hypothetical protein